MLAACRPSSATARQDLEEALQFGGEGKVAAHFSWDFLDNINDILDRMEHGGIEGRIVLNLT